MPTTKLLLFGLTAATVMLAVSNGQAAEPVRGADEPRELLERQAKAVVTGDKTLYLSTFSTETPYAKAYLAAREAAFDAIVTAQAFRANLTKVYGSAGAAKAGPPLELADLGDIPDPAGIEAHAKNAKIKMTGNSAITDGWGDNPAAEQRLIQQNGKWFVDPADANPSINTADQRQALAMMIGMLKTITQPMKDILPLIGQPGQTPETIKAEFEKKVQVLTGAGTTPANPVQAPKPDTAAADTPFTGPVPYGIDKRPLPTDDKIDTLAPQQVGAFQRGKIKDRECEPGTRCQYVSYAKTGDKSPEAIVIGVFVHPNPAAAQQKQKSQCLEDPEYRRRQHRFDTDPSFYRDPESEGGYFYYTRGRFGFMVQAWNGEEDLDAFMAAFPW